MKKTILAILAACAMISTAHAQTAVVVQRPSLLSDLAETVGALVALPIVLPVAVAEGIVSGTAEAADAIMNGTSEVYVVPAQPVVTQPVVVQQPVVQQPVVVQQPIVLQQPVVTQQVVVRQRSVVVPAPAPVIVAPRPPARYRVRLR